MGALHFFRLFLEVVGGLVTIFSIGLFIWAIISWSMGIFPLFLRLGFGRWSRKIKIAANGDIYKSLEDDMKSTGIFRKGNIEQITSGSLAKIKDASLVLVHYPSFTEEEIRRLVSFKRPGAGFIFYFPEFNPPTNVIPSEMLKIINNEPFTAVVNFRGRLMNDIITTLLSTSYDKR